jgi:muramidase (phage lysozyme)
MALGTVRASGGLQSQLVSSRAGDINAQATSSLGDAVNRLTQTGLGYLNSATEIEAVYDRREQASQGLELDTNFLQYQQDRAKDFTEFSRGRSENPYGMTKEYDAALAEKEAEFLSTVPPRFQESAKARLAQDRAVRVGSAFTAELSLLDTVDTKNLNRGLTTLGSGLKGGGVTLEDAQASWEDMVTKSSLPAADKQSFIENGRATLQGLEFGTIVEQSAAGYGSVADGTNGNDVVMAGALPQERAVLNVIAQNEAPNYNVWNGGTTFEGYEDHPAATGKAPGESSAAGRYQFILGTWRAASASYEKTYGVKVPDFSPEWQDRVALHWAERQFNAHHKGASFKEILASGDPQQMLMIRDVLGKPRSQNPNDLEWAGLGQMGDAEFISAMMGEQGIAGGGTGPAAGPNVWTDPRFSDLSLEAKMSFANSASAAANQQKQSMASTIQLERETFLDNAYNAGYQNQPGVLEALQGSSFWNAEAQARYNSGQEVFRSSEKKVTGVGASIAAGIPLMQSDSKAFGEWFGSESFQGIAAGTSAAYSRMRGAVESARMFPDGSQEAFSAALANADTAPNALAFLASAMTGDPSILKRSGFNQDTIAQVQLYSNLAKREPSGEKAFEAYSRAIAVEQTTAKTPQQLTSEGAELFAQSYPTADTVVDLFDGWFTAAPNSTMNPALEGQLMQDASTAYYDGYRQFGNAEGAEAYMQSSLQNLYGVSQTQRTRSSWGPGDSGGTSQVSVLMRYPPEKFYPSVKDDYGYLYTAISDFAVSNGAQANGAVLIPDDITDKEVRSGKLPTYKVLGTGEFGEAIVLPGRFGGDTLETSAKQTITADATAENSLEYVDKFSAELADLETQLSAAQTMYAPPAKIDSLIQRIDTADQKRKAAVSAAVEQGYMSADALTQGSDVYVGNLVEDFTGRMQGNEALSRRLGGLTTGGDPTEAMVMTIARELRVPKSIASLVAIEMQRNAE